MRLCDNWKGAGMTKKSTRFVWAGIAAVAATAGLAATWYSWGAMRWCSVATGQRAAALSGLDIVGRAIDRDGGFEGATCYYRARQGQYYGVVIVRVVRLPEQPEILYVRQPGRDSDVWTHPWLEEARGGRG